MKLALIVQTLTPSLQRLNSPSSHNPCLAPHHHTNISPPFSRDNLKLSRRGLTLRWPSTSFLLLFGANAIVDPFNFSQARADGTTTEDGDPTLSSPKTLGCLALPAAHWLARAVYSSDLVSDPGRTLFILWVVQCPIVILGYAFFRRDAESCAYLRAVGRGIVAVPAGALLNAFGAVVLGSPIGLEYLTRTVNWSLLMSFFTVVPAAACFGSSWKDWQRLFACTKPCGRLDYLICIPAHGAVIGAWFGAWPMPLDWERPWQEWPICVTYGAILGYLLGVFASLAFMCLCKTPRFKAE